MNLRHTVGADPRRKRRRSRRETTGLVNQKHRPQEVGSRHRNDRIYTHSR